MKSIILVPALAVCVFGISKPVQADEDHPQPTCPIGATCFTLPYDPACECYPIVVEISSNIGGGSTVGTSNHSINVPEPITAALVLTGLVALLWQWRRHRNKKHE